MKKLLITAALCAFAAPAYAGNILVTGYTTPDDPEAFYHVTTTVPGDPDTPYNYYTGPIVFQLSTGQSMVVYCTDLNHWLQTPTTYSYGPLLLNGQGDSIPTQTSYAIGVVASIGGAALLAGEKSGVSATNKELDFDMAAAAQAVIWDLGYPTATTTFDSTVDGAQIATDVGFLDFEVAGLAKIKGQNPALAIQPYGEGWWQNGSASQQMVLASGVPEPSTWAMGLIGFATMAGLAAFNRRKAARYIEV